MPMSDTIALQSYTARTPRVATPPEVRRAVQSWAKVWTDPEKARRARAAKMHAELDRFDAYVPAYHSRTANEEGEASEAATLSG